MFQGPLPLSRKALEMVGFPFWLVEMREVYGVIALGREALYHHKRLVADKVGTSYASSKMYRSMV